MASDSRLSNGQRFDYAQKVFQTPRKDTLIAFAGDTSYAYPLLMQVMRAIEGYPFSADGRLTLPKLKGHILRVFQQSYDAIHDLPRGESWPEAPDNFFLLAGFDWQAGDFKCWQLSFDVNSHKFIYRPILGSKQDPFFFASDDRVAVSDAIAATRKKLGMSSRNSPLERLDMEPFEVLSEIIGDSQYPTIGGAPQLGKIYRSMNTCLFQVRLGDSAATDSYVMGRPLLHGEKSDFPVFDPKIGFHSVRS
ncbi:hypothetical protein FHR75_004422 [Kineococcus radiotolerans]|uniref:Uncharacterized protein n=1 Tax=Kineococcus radiotolerans TaxID=131568 RepID=A0A7W4TR83_KINRA|nr:hypothetical protein [Kineococcus radiotolerans]MBB2903579.1 hypothetical protein [Kineococcus radiotolerans]